MNIISIVRKHLGREGFISYREEEQFIKDNSELDELNAVNIEIPRITFAKSKDTLGIR